MRKSASILDRFQEGPCKLADTGVGIIRQQRRVVTVGDDADSPGDAVLEVRTEEIADPHGPFPTCLP